MDYKALLSKEWIRYLGILILGVTVGALFYPTSQIQETISKKYEQQVSSLKESHKKEIQELTDKYLAKVEENFNLKVETEKKLNALSLEIRDLKSKQKTSYYKLVKPDGTVEIKKFSESEVTESTKVIVQVQEEFKQKIDQIENKWSEIHRERLSKIQKDFDSKESEYKKTISQLEASRTVSVNPRTTAFEVGYLSDRSYYANASTPIWGPLIIGLQGSIDKNNNTSALLGVGIQF